MLHPLSLLGCTQARLMCPKLDPSRLSNGLADCAHYSDILERVSRLATHTLPGWAPEGRSMSLRGIEAITGQTRWRAGEIHVFNHLALR